ncbi:hypothetical protein G6F22_018141 [Rhizopus arrhizus]|nr:hypothetical protein G6F22_018141 [Rhizopus arrhizus]
MPWRPAAGAAVAPGHQPLRPRRELGLPVVAAAGAGQRAAPATGPAAAAGAAAGSGATPRAARGQPGRTGSRAAPGHAAVGRAGAGAGHAPARLRPERRTAHPAAAGQLGLCLQFAGQPRFSACAGAGDRRQPCPVR